MDPEVVLNPVNLALHLVAFSETSLPLRIPIGWLWEEIDRRHSLLVIADIFAYRTHDPAHALEEPLWKPFHTANMNDPSVLHTTAAFLSMGRQYGYLEFVASSDYEAFLRDRNIANWSSYLMDLVGNECTDIGKSVRYKGFAEQTTFDLVSKRAGIEAKVLRDIYARNQNWNERTPEEFPLYEQVRRL